MSDVQSSTVSNDGETDLNVNAKLHSDAAVVNLAATHPTVVTSAINNIDGLQPDWKYRRNVVFYSLGFCALMIFGITTIDCAALILNIVTNRPVSIDQNLANLINTLMYIVATFAGSTVGMYVFGSNFDSKDYRSSVGNIVDKMIVNRRGDMH